MKENIIEHSAIVLQYKGDIRVSALISSLEKRKLFKESQKDIQKKSYFLVKSDFLIKPVTMSYVGYGILEKIKKTSTFTRMEPNKRSAV